jgi:hypothetical protein
LLVGETVEVAGIEAPWQNEPAGRDNQEPSTRGAIRRIKLNKIACFTEINDEDCGAFDGLMPDQSAA